MQNEGNLTRKGRLRKKIGPHTNEMRAYKKQKLWENVNNSVQNIEDNNPQNRLLRSIYFNKAKGYSLGPDFEAQNLPLTWHLVDKGGRTGHSEYPFVLTFSGHVHSCSQMEDLILRILEKGLKQGQINTYKVTDGPLLVQQLDDDACDNILYEAP